MAEEAYAYIVRCADGTYYTGWSTDPERRLAAHNSGRGAAYTRARRPVRLVYVERLPTRSAAMRRERRIKQMSRQDKTRHIRAARPPQDGDDPKGG